VTFLTVLALLVGCAADPLDTLLPDERVAWETDAPFQEARSGLDPEDQARLDAFKERYRPGGPMGDQGWIAKTSIRRALDEQARFDEQAAAAQAMRDAKDAAFRARVDALRAIVDVRLIAVESKAAWRAGERSQLFAMFRVENRNDKQVVAFKGKAAVSNGPRLLADVPVLVSDPIAGRSAIDWRYDFDYDPTSGSQQTLSTTRVENLRVVWNPERIDFSDGTIADLE
jgi:hypothetical protein